MNSGEPTSGHTAIPEYLGPSCFSTGVRLRLLRGTSQVESVCLSENPVVALLATLNHFEKRSVVTSVLTQR